MRMMAAVVGAVMSCSIGAACAEELDFDKDGVSDETDQCPTMAGLAEESGCPPMRQVPSGAALKIAKLTELIAFNNLLVTKESLPAINEISEICMTLPEGLHMDIHVYTDDAADEDANRKLSLDRAEALGELIHGCARPAATRVFGEGAGEEPPAGTDEMLPPADRVELKLFFDERINPDTP